MVGLPAFASPTHERTYSYYGYNYGPTNDDHCTCRVGPCFPELLGQKTYSCNGAVYSWGITTGTCFDRVELETVPCGSGAASAVSTSASEPADSHAEVTNACSALLE